MQGLVNFIKYNNAVPIVLGVLFFGSTAAFAATDPQAIYSQQSQVVSVDNTYIANKDLATWTPKIFITGVTEDADNYYVAYAFNTIDVVDYTWKDATKNLTMTVSKADLGPRDLGVYVTSQFRNIIANEISYLTDVQNKAKNAVSQKVVATTYGGLIGKFLDSSTETLPGYTPVVQPQSSGDQSAAVANAGGSSQNSGNPGGSSGGAGGSSSLMSLQLLGNNPVRLPLGQAYLDLGVVLVDPQAPNLGYHAFVDDYPSDPPSVDTSTTSVHTIEYRATDQAGNNLLVRRVVIVGDATDPGTEINTAGNVGSPQPMPAAVVTTDASSTPATATTTSDTTTTTTTSDTTTTTTSATTSTATTDTAASTTTANTATASSTPASADTTATSTAAAPPPVVATSTPPAAATTTTASTAADTSTSTSATTTSQ